MRISDWSSDVCSSDLGREIGYPLLVKASAGGGRIGIRRVDRPEALGETVAATQSMAAKAFGDGAIFLERFVPNARPVEIPIFGFGDGAAVPDRKSCAYGTCVPVRCELGGGRHTTKK